MEKLYFRPLANGVCCEAHMVTPSEFQWGYCELSEFRASMPNALVQRRLLTRTEDFNYLFRGRSTSQTLWNQLALIHHGCNSGL